MAEAARAGRWGAIASLALAFGTVPVLGGDALIEPPLVRGDFVGTLSCTSTSCHGQPAAQAGGGFVWQQVYARWLGLGEQHTGDPHARAAQRMREPRFLEVLRRYSTRNDGTVDPGAAQKCVGCHNPMGQSRDALSAAELSGIGCETCHGGAKRWLAAHYQWSVSREELINLGLVDTKDLPIRARVCASCHVGSGANDMNHDMIAAGHPPLRFEMASYEALIPHRHWDDRPRRKAEPDYEVQLWAAGRAASAAAMLELLAGRAAKAMDGGGNGIIPWPEFSESNCFACHQSLTPTALASLANTTERNSGTLPWQWWNHALLGEALGQFGPRFGELRAAMERTLVPDAAEINRLARQAPDELFVQLSGQETGYGVTQSLLVELANTRATTWDEQCQYLAALVAVRRALGDQGRLDRGATLRIAERQRNIAAGLRAPAATDAARRELEMLRSELLAAFDETPSEPTPMERAQ